LSDPERNCVLCGRKEWLKGVLEDATQEKKYQAEFDYNEGRENEV
jgi:hypothetical protein